MKNRILVVGGGAAGMMAAITAAKMGSAVTIYEKNDRIGKKILVTGNGKCNLSNEEMSEQFYHTGDTDKLKRCLLKFDYQDTVLFFKECGLLLKNKNGYLYPACEQASVVLDILRLKLKQLQVVIKTQVEDINISKQGNTFLVTSLQGENTVKALFDAVIFACGSYAGMKKEKQSAGYEYAKHFGHTILPILPALVQVRCQESFFKAIGGVRTDALLALYVDNNLIESQRGELQLTEYGISGIPVFQLSHQIAKAVKEGKQTKVCIDFLPDYENDEWEMFIRTRMLSMDGETIENFLLGTLHKKINNMLIQQAGLKPEEKVSEDTNKRVLEVCRSMKHLSVTPVKVNPYENAQVCLGGIDFKELTEELESTKQKGIFFCGEMVDVDGMCGGYNLQWAWTSGFLAGRKAAQIDKDKEKQ